MSDQNKTAWLGLGRAEGDEPTQTPAAQKPPKATIAALERVFAAEIHNRLPFQSKAMIYGRLCADGLVEPMERKFWAVTVTGYALTDWGRLVYCENCPEPVEGGV